jgi:hypothetical protein
MIKDFEVTNVKPSTASRLLQQMKDHVFNPKAISNIIAKKQKTWISVRGISTKAASAQVLVDHLTVSPDSSCVFLLHDPNSPLTGSAKKGRPKKSLPLRVVTKDFNSEVVETELIPDMSAEQYTIAPQKVIYLTESDCIFLYVAWITNKELPNNMLYTELLAVDTMGDTNIEDCMMMIVTG